MAATPRLPLPLPDIVGAEQAARIIRRAANQLAELDLLPDHVALGLACERALGSDPWLLATPGQEWQLDDSTAPLPAQRVAVIDRFNGRQEPTVVLRPLDGPLESRLVECPVQALTSYRLASWELGADQPGPH